MTENATHLGGIFSEKRKATPVAAESAKILSASVSKQREVRHHQSNFLPYRLFENPGIHKG